MISSMHSSAAARPTSGCEPAPRPSVTCAPSWISRSDLDMVSACASVLATTNSTPFSPARDHVVDGIAAAAADAEDGDARLEFGDVRLLQIDRHCLVLCLSCRLAAAAADGLCPSSSSEAVPEPLPMRWKVPPVPVIARTRGCPALAAARNPRPADRSAGRPPPRTPGPWPLRAARPRRADGRSGRCAPSMRRAASGRPASWLAPPVSTTRLPTALP